MNFLRRLLRRQDGITLVMAVGILGVLTVSGTTLIYYPRRTRHMAFKEMTRMLLSFLHFAWTTPTN